MNVLSLFDGISCGQVALERANIKVNNYFASEVDKYAIQITQKNYPNTIQLGDVTKVNSSELPKIDLLIGGSPCQGFSFAGKQLNFNDERSKLFFEYVRLLKEIKPKYFLLENVKMKKEYQDVISSYLGVEPIEINSALVSAQNRKRLYWTNIPNIKQPKDKGILIKDILENENEVSEKYYLSKKATFRTLTNKRSRAFTQDETKGSTDSLYHIADLDIRGHDSIKRVYSIDGKCPTLTTMGGGHREPKVLIVPTKIRKLTPLECERLQTLPDNHTDGVSNTQRYKALGNGFTVDIIAHIFKEIK